MSKYFIVSQVLIFLFILLSILVSPGLFPYDNLLFNIDESTFIQINKSRIDNPLINQFMVYLSVFGREFFWIPVVGLVFAFGGWIGKKTAVIMTMSFLVVVVIGSIDKTIVNRDRPFIITSDSDKSFPSGHAALVSAGATTALVLLRGSIRRDIISVGLALEAALVSFSRIYLGWHYPLDVAGGIILGVGIAFVFVAAEKQIEILMRDILTFLTGVKDRSETK